MTHPVDDVYKDGIPVSKADVRNYEGKLASFDGPAEIPTYDLNGVSGMFVVVDGADGVGTFIFDTADTTSPHDPASGVLVSASGRRFKRINPIALITAAELVAKIGTNALALNQLVDSAVNGKVVGYPIGSDGQAVKELSDAELIAIIDAITGSDSWRNPVLGVANPVLSFGTVGNKGRAEGGSGQYFIGANGQIYGSGAGLNDNLGNMLQGASTPRPLRLPGPSGVSFVSITQGTYHAIAIDSDGYPWALGRNNLGQLGVGDTTNRDILTRIPFFFDNSIKVTEVKIFPEFTSGQAATLFLGNNGKLYYCGANAVGEAGTGAAAGVPITTPVVWGGTTQGDEIDNVTLFEFSTFTASVHVVGGLTPTLYAAGYNVSGQLGVGDSLDKNSATPVAVVGADVVKVGKSTFNTFLVMADGSVLGAGNGSNGQMTEQYTTNQDTFVTIAVPGAPTIVDIAVAADTNTAVSSMMLLDDQGRIYSWGYNVNGACGQGDNTSPAPIELLVGSFQGSVVRIAFGNGAGTQYGVIEAAGELLTVGQNTAASGQLVNGTKVDDTNTYSPIVGLSGTLLDWGVFGLDAGSTGRLMVKTDKAVLAGGYNASGRLGVDSTIQAVNVLQDVILTPEYG